MITDRPAPELSDRFSMPPNQFKLADTGTVYFSSGGSTGLFQWDPESGARQRLLQTNDPLETLGLTLPPAAVGGLVDTAGRLLQVNAAGHAALLLTAAMKGSMDPGAICLFDGASYREMKTPLDSVSQFALNNQDKAAVLGSSKLPTSAFPVPGIYLSGPEMTAVEVAVGGKPAPAAVGGTYSNLRQLIGINDAGQVAFLADISGGNAQRAIFLFDGNEVRVVAKSGTAPGSLTGFSFDAPASGVNYVLNNNGKVAFRASTVGGNTGIWTGDAAGAPQKIAGLGEPAGVQELGNCSMYLWLRGFNDSDRVLYDCLTQPGARNTLLLKNPSDAAPQVVLQRGQALGAAGNFVATQQASLNNAGKAAVLASLTGGPSPLAWFLVPGDAEPVKIAAAGEATPAGGAFGLAGTSASGLINAGDQVLFLADIMESNAVGLFTWTSAGGVKPVVTSMDALPEGANTVLRAGFPSTSDTETLVQFRKAGGQATYYAAPLNPGASGPRKILSEFDAAPDLGTVAGPDNLAMNGKGEVVFTAALLGAKSYPAAGILASLPDSGLQKAVLVGESVPGGDTIVSIGPPQINNQSQVAFLAATATAGQPTPGQGIFIAPVIPAADGILAVARQGEALPGGGAFVTWPNAFSGMVLNDSGQVAFRGTVDGGSGAGVFVGSGGGNLRKVVRSGDRVAEGVSIGLGLPSTIKLNAAGQVAFVIGLTGSGRTQGVFLATPGETEYTVQALAMNDPPGQAPDGKLKFGLFREDALDLANTGQVAFWCTSSAGNGGGGGWFSAWSPTQVMPRLLQTQSLADNLRVGPLFPAKGMAALADSGDLAVYVPEMNGSNVKPRIFIVAPDGKWRYFALNGETAGSTGSEFGKLYLPLSATPSGKFLFSAVLLNGPVQAGVFIDRP